MTTSKCTGLVLLYFYTQIYSEIEQEAIPYFYDTKIENDEFDSIIKLFTIAISKKCIYWNRKKF